MSSGSARLFVALELPAAARTALDAWRRSALGAGEQVAIGADDRGAVGADGRGAVGGIGRASVGAPGRDAAGGIGRASVGPPTGLRFIDPGALHVTLCFLGSRPVAEIDAIASACASALDGQGSPSLRLGEPLWLPRRRPGVLAVRLRDPGGRLAGVQEGLARALQAGGWYEPERRTFLPHVTVARVARGSRVHPVELAPPESLQLAGDTVTLFRSWTGGSGARYEGLASVRLGSI